MVLVASVYGVGTLASIPMTVSVQDTVWTPLGYRRACAAASQLACSRSR